jgi:hypothetical protein
MNTTTIKKTALQLLLAAAAIAPIPSAQAHGHPPEDDFKLHTLLADVRKATSPFTDLQVALAANYVKFPDLSGDCVAQPGQGGMGIHYLNAALLDAELDPLRPEMLVYRKTARQARTGRARVRRVCAGVGRPSSAAACSVRPPASPGANAKPVRHRHAAVRAAPLAMGAQPQRSVQRLESGGLLRLMARAIATALKRWRK